MPQTRKEISRTIHFLEHAFDKKFFKDLNTAYEDLTNVQSIANDKDLKSSRALLDAAKAAAIALKFIESIRNTEYNMKRGLEHLKKVDNALHKEYLLDMGDGNEEAKIKTLAKHLAKERNKK